MKIFVNPYDASRKASTINGDTPHRTATLCLLASLVLPVIVFFLLPAFPQIGAAAKAILSVTLMFCLLGIAASRISLVAKLCLGFAWGTLVAVLVLSMWVR
jgi:hypothetical protein